MSDFKIIEKVQEYSRRKVGKRLLEFRESWLKQLDHTQILNCYPIFYEKKGKIWHSPMTKAPAPTGRKKSEKQRDNNIFGTNIDWLVELIQKRSCFISNMLFHFSVIVYTIMSMFWWIYVKWPYGYFSYIYSPKVLSSHF